MQFHPCDVALTSAVMYSTSPPAVINELRNVNLQLNSTRLDMLPVLYLNRFGAIPLGGLECKDILGQRSFNGAQKSKYSHLGDTDAERLFIHVRKNDAAQIDPNRVLGRLQAPLSQDESQENYVVAVQQQTTNKQLGKWLRDAERGSLAGNLRCINERLHVGEVNWSVHGESLERFTAKY